MVWRSGRPGIARARCAAAVLLAVAGLSSCGGASPGERAAAMRSWSAHADAACRRTQAAIVARGEPRTPVDVGESVRSAVADLRRLAGEIRSLRSPPGDEERVRRFERALDRAIGSATRIADAAPGWRRIGAAVKRWRRDAYPLDVAARRAGLRSCGSYRQQVAAADALLAPVYRMELAAFVVTFQRRAVALYRAHPPDRPDQALAYFERASDLFFRFGDRFGELDVPHRLLHRHEMYALALEDEQFLLDDIAFTMRERRRPERVPQRLRRAQARADRELRALLRAARAPTPPGEMGGGTGDSA